MAVDVPLKFDICSSGKAKVEANTKCFSYNLGDGIDVSLVNVAIGCTDNAALATTKELEELKAAEEEEISRVISEELAVCQLKLWHTAKAYA